jgi:hypothetical protein
LKEGVVRTDGVRLSTFHEYSCNSEPRHLFLKEGVVRTDGVIVNKFEELSKYITFREY